MPEKWHLADKDRSTMFCLAHTHTKTQPTEWQELEEGWRPRDYRVYPAIYLKLMHNPHHPSQVSNAFLKLLLGNICAAWHKEVKLNAHGLCHFSASNPPENYSYIPEVLIVTWARLCCFHGCANTHRLSNFTPFSTDLLLQFVKGEEGSCFYSLCVPHWKLCHPWSWVLASNHFAWPGLPEEIYRHCHVKAFWKRLKKTIVLYYFWDL